jgi:hypothetical protein
MKVQIDLQSDVVLAYGNAIDGVNVFDIPFEDYTPEKYSYTPLVAGVFNPNGFALRTVAESIDFAKRQDNINRMSNYMNGLLQQGQLTQPNLDLFFADIATNVQGYLNGGGRLITWIETVNRNGYNATTIGFKTKTAYRGFLVGTVYPRAEDILVMLNDL